MLFLDLVVWTIWQLVNHCVFLSLILEGVIDHCNLILEKAQLSKICQRILEVLGY